MDLRKAMTGTGKETTNRQLSAPAILVRTSMITKDHILAEIRRITDKYGGRPPGKMRFETETGIREGDWLGRFWARWGDALKEAGFKPNPLQGRHDDEAILGKLVEVIRRFGRMPTVAEIRLRHREDPNIPSHGTIGRLGNKAALAAKLVEFCQRHPGHEDILRICTPLAKATTPAPQVTAIKESGEDEGYVYLMKSGRYYKVGRTNSPGRREREFQIQLPERPRLIHQIRTDDPPGIEAYWHKRFESRRIRKEAEFFDLSPQDVAAFKRWRLI